MASDAEDRAAGLAALRQLAGDATLPPMLRYRAAKALLDALRPPSSRLVRGKPRPAAPTATPAELAAQLDQLRRRA